MRLRQFLSGLVILLANVPLVRALTRIESPKGAVATYADRKVTVQATATLTAPKLSLSFAKMAAVAPPGFRVTIDPVNHQFNTVRLSWTGETGPFVIWGVSHIGDEWAPVRYTPPTFDNFAIVPINPLVREQYYIVQARSYQVFIQSDASIQPRVVWTCPSV